MKNTFYKKPKIIEGHSFEEYSNRFAKHFIVYGDDKKLNPHRKYWLIDNKYYEINDHLVLKSIGIGIGILGVITSIVVPTVLSYASKERYKSYDFKYWNDNASLTSLKNFVEESVTPNNKKYIAKEDRIATFDMDGTLYGERAPIYIEWLMYHDYLNNKHPEKKSLPVNIIHHEGEEGEFKESKTLEEIDNHVVDFMNRRKDESGLLEMREAYGGAELFSGLTIKEYLDYVDSFLEKDVTNYFSNLKFKDMFYKPMIEVVEFLQLNNFDVYVVSGTDRFMVRDIVNKHLSIPSNKVIGMDVSLDLGKDGIVRRGNKLMYKNVEKVKVELITQEIGKKPVLSFGNSSGDADMHDYALSNEKYPQAQAYMVNNDDDEREYINNRDWSKKNYKVFSMKSDFKTIYGDNVKKIGK